MEHSYAGLFLWIDLRPFMLDDSEDVEKQHLLRKTVDLARHQELEALIDRTCMKHGVSIARGSLFGTEELGWVRLTFTISEEEIRLGIQRLGKALEEVKGGRWGGKPLVVRNAGR